MAKALRIILGLGLVALVAAGGVWGTRQLVSEESSESERSRPQATRVGLDSPRELRIEDALSGVGTLSAIRSLALAPAASGRVTEVPVASGETVGEGDVLIRLDDRAARAALADAEASLRETRNEFRRVEELAESNAAAEARLEEARAAFRRAEAAAMSARAALDDRTLSAPFAGTLGLIDVEVGSYLTTGTTVSTLSDLSSVEVELSLPERYFDRVAPGQTITVTTPAYPDEVFEGSVTVRAPEINLATRSFDLRGEIANPDGRLVGGMFADARVVLGTHDGLAIPDDAIISEGLATYVFTVSDGTAARREIVPGASIGSLTEVREGLDAGDRVVVAGWDNLSDGATVTVDEDYARKGLE